MTIADVLRHEGGMPAFSQQMNIEDCYPENINNNNVGKIIEDEELKYPQGEYRHVNILRESDLLSLTDGSTMPSLGA